jgi:hypothetical protein
MRVKAMAPPADFAALKEELDVGRDEVAPRFHREQPHARVEAKRPVAPAHR